MHLSTTLLLPALISSVLAVQFPLAQPCFDAADKIAGCKYPAAGASWTDYNKCACKNTGGWLVNSAKCIKNKDPGNLDQIFVALEANCVGTGTPIVFDLGTWQMMAGLV